MGYSRDINQSSLFLKSIYNATVISPEYDHGLSGYMAEQQSV